MLRILSCIALAFAFGCGKTGVTGPLPQAHEGPQAERLGKTSLTATHAEVVLTFKRNDRPVSDGYIEFKYPSIEVGTDILALARADSQGQASFMFWPQSERETVYTARVFEGENLIGTWQNVPVIVGYKVVVNLPENGNPVETYREPLTPIHRVPIDWDATGGATSGSGSDGDAIPGGDKGD